MNTVSAEPITQMLDHCPCMICSSGLEGTYSCLIFLDRFDPLTASGTCSRDRLCKPARLQCLLYKVVKGFQICRRLMRSARQTLECVHAGKLCLIRRSPFGCLEIRNSLGVVHNTCEIQIFWLQLFAYWWYTCIRQLRHFRNIADKWKVCQYLDRVKMLSGVGHRWLKDSSSSQLLEFEVENDICNNGQFSAEDTYTCLYLHGGNVSSQEGYDFRRFGQIQIVSGWGVNAMCSLNRFVTLAKAS